MLSALSPIAASPSAAMKSSGAIAVVAPKRSATPPASHLLTAAAPVNASSPANPRAGLRSMCGVNVRMAPPDAVITTSAAIGPASTRHSLAAGPCPESSAGARSRAPRARAIGQASGIASAGRTASTKTSPNPALSASQGATGTRMN